jgi:hypothetical protein
VVAVTYRVEVFRDSDLWVFRVPELDVVGQTRTLAATADTARGLIALWLDIDPNGVEVEVDYHLVDEIAFQLAAEARQQQLEAGALTKAAAATWRQAARRLVCDDGLSVRDAAAMLGVSYGRIHQLVQ